MRVVYLGTPAFAVPALRALADARDIEIPLVITQPDRPAGRGKALASPAVKLAATALGLPVLQPETMRDPEALDALAAARADLLVVVAYGELLRRPVLDAAPHGALNVHPSLLPRYRGAAPIPAAILAGDSQTGVSIIRLIRRLDAGPLVAQDALDIMPDDTSATLSERLASRAATMLPRVCRDYVSRVLTPAAQDEALATYTREWTKDDARIDWSAPAVAIERLIRAAQPWPVAWTTAAGTRLQILAATPRADIARVGDPGAAAMLDGRVMVATGAGALELRTVQPAGKRAIAAADWWRGLRAERLQLG